MVLLCRARELADADASKKTSASRATYVSLKISKRKSVMAAKRTLIAPSVRSLRRVIAQRAREANAQIYATVTMSATLLAMERKLKLAKLNSMYRQQEIKEMATMHILKVKTKAMNEENEIERGASRRSRSKIITNFL